MDDIFLSLEAIYGCRKVSLEVVPITIRWS